MISQNGHDREYLYEGCELELFSRAVNWKSYWMGVIAPFVAGSVLEVGAGLGELTVQAESFGVESWTALEPDPLMASTIQSRIDESCRTSVVCHAGTTEDYGDGRSEFDAVLYIDVLEHIRDDEAELRRARNHLKPGGHLIVLSPAHQFLYSPFDAAIGHYRRYSRKELVNLGPDGLELVVCKYLDSVGLLASLGNRLLTRQEEPKASQVAFWDGKLVPMSRRLDSRLRFRVGKSVLGIWRKID